MEFEFNLFKGRPTDPLHKEEENEIAVYDFLDSLGVDYSTMTHKEVVSMEECELVRKNIGAPVFKNLFLTNKQQTQFYLLMMPADKPFKTKYLSSQLNCARLSFGTPEMMWELLHIRPGAVSPMGLVHDVNKKVRLIVDRELSSHESYACHPCVNTASVLMSLTDLLDRVVTKTGHSFTWVDLTREAEQQKSYSR